MPEPLRFRTQVALIVSASFTDMSGILVSVDYSVQIAYAC